MQLATSRAETADKAAELKAAASKHTAEIDQNAAELATLRSELAAAKDVTTNGSASSPPPSSDNEGAVTADAVQAAAVHRALEVAVDELRAELAESTRSGETLRAEVESLRAQALENAAGNGAVVADTVVDDAELVALRAEVAALKANVETANGRGTTADEAAALQEAVDSTAQALRAEHEAEVTVMMQSIEAAQSKAGKLQEELDVKDRRVNELGAKVAQLGKELAEAQRTAADQLGALGNEIEALRNDKEQFTTDGEEASDAIKELATECTALRTEVRVHARCERVRLLESTLTRISPFSPVAPLAGDP
jgi:chromosome segregation ATPase